MKKKIFLTSTIFVFIITLLVLFVFQQDDSELLSVEETLKIAQTDIELIWHYREPWLCNPEARDDIYALVNKRTSNRSKPLKIIGIIGDESDVPRLLSLFPSSNENIEYIDKDIFYGVIVALALLSNRGITIAGDTLGEMTSPQYWKEKNLAVDRNLGRDPFYQTAWRTLYTFPFAGREDFEVYLQAFLDKIDDSKTRNFEEIDMHSRYVSVVKREKDMGTWQVQGRPQRLPRKRLWVTT